MSNKMVKNNKITKIENNYYLCNTLHFQRKRRNHLT